MEAVKSPKNPQTGFQACWRRTSGLVLGEDMVVEGME